MLNQPKPLLQDILAHEQLSEHVTYMSYRREDAAKEGVLVSERFYPGIRYKGRMYWGIHQGNRFIPGVSWCGRFIPGLMTRRGFFPGLATKDGFTLGIIVAGVFMPGVVHGSNFVPGVERDGRFLPGVFDASRRFVSGRFKDSAFESGVITNVGFEPAPYEPLRPSAAHALTKEGFGIAEFRRTTPLGGLPLRGVVVGTVPDAVVYLPNGLATTRGVIIGGLGPKEDLTTLDPLQELGDFGFELEDPNDPGNVLGTDGIVDRLEKRLSDMLPGDTLGSSSQSVMGALADAMDGMSQGRNQAIDSLNQGWADYWNNLLGSNAGGMVTGAGKGLQQAGRTGGWVAGGAAGMMAGFKTGAALGTAVGGPVGTVIGGVAGAVLGAAGAVAGGDEGASLGGKIVDWIADAAATVWHALFGGEEKKEEGKKGGSTSQPGEDGQEGYGGMLFNPVKPIGPYISRKKAVIEIDHGESGTMSTVHTDNTPVRITMTDTGALLIVDYAALRKLLVTNPERGVSVGINPLTGSTVLIPGKIGWKAIYEQSKMPWWLEKIGHPIEQ